MPWHGKTRFDLIPAARHPYQLLLATWAFFSGMGLLTGWQQPKSLDHALPQLTLHLWAATLFLSGAMLIFGAAWSRPFVGGFIEGAGQVALAVMGWVYAVALIAVNGLGPAWGVALLVASYATASAWRVLQIARGLRKEWRKVRLHRAAATL